MVFGRKKIYCSLCVDDYEQGEGVDEEDVCYFIWNDELGLQEPLLEVPDLANVAFAEGSDYQLGQTEEPSSEVFFRDVIDVPQDVFP